MTSIYLELAAGHWMYHRYELAIPLFEQVLQDELVSPRLSTGSAENVRSNNARHSWVLAWLAICHLDAARRGADMPHEPRVLAYEMAADYFNEWIEWNESHPGDDDRFAGLQQGYKQDRDSALAQAAGLRQLEGKVTP